MKFSFKNYSLFNTAFVHPSFSNETSYKVEHNERLEFLGDSVLGLITVEMLYTTFPKLKEGELAKKKSILVSEPVLASIAKELDLGRYLLLGKGEETANGRERISNLADLMEALLGAMYLDGGFEKTKKWLLPHLKNKLKRVNEFQYVKDAKSLLQEFTQKLYKKVPTYQVLEEKGLEHKKEFVVEVQIEGKKAQGKGQNKKEAETNAARKLLEILEKTHLMK